jgi:UDP-2-acetamido-3-amino-2,3-dideoxy-glucuronate N-acetyltransferase
MPVGVLGFQPLTLSRLSTMDAKNLLPERSVHSSEGAENLRVAVVGCGYWGKNVVRSFSKLKALHAIVESDRETQVAIAREFSARCLTYDETLNDSTVDAVAIAAPAQQHFELAKRALIAGKHVLVEKPLALTVEHARYLCQLATDRELCLMVGHLLQFHPAFNEVRRVIDDGEVGKILYISSTRRSPGRIRDEEDVVWSFAPHDLSMILSLAGARASVAQASGHRLVREAILDTATVSLSFPSGVQADFNVSWLHPVKEQRLVVVGTKAMVLFDDCEPWERKVRVYRHRVDASGEKLSLICGEVQTRPITPAEPLLEECRHFIACASNGLEPRTNGAEGLRVVEVLSEASAMLKKTCGVSTSEILEGHGQGHSTSPAVHQSAYIDTNVQIGDGTKIWHFSHLLPNTSVGRNVTIGQNVLIGPNVKVGDGCKIQNNVSIYEGVILEENVFCGPSCVFTNVKNPRAFVNRKAEFQRTHVHEGVTIGANATIVCGCSIGRYAFIAAGAVVTRNVPAFALMAGVPARRVGWMSHAGEKLGADLYCRQSGRRYRAVGANILEEVPA